MIYFFKRICPRTVQNISGHTFLDDQHQDFKNYFIVFKFHHF